MEELFVQEPTIGTGKNARKNRQTPSLQTKGEIKVMKKIKEQG